MALPNEWIGVSSLDVFDRYETKYRSRSPYDWMSAITSTAKRCNDCSSVNLTVLTQSGDEILQIIYGNEGSFFNSPIQGNIASLLMPNEQKFC